MKWNFHRHTGWCSCRRWNSTRFCRRFTRWRRRSCWWWNGWCSSWHCWQCGT